MDDLHVRSVTCDYLGRLSVPGARREPNSCLGKSDLLRRSGHGVTSNFNFCPGSELSLDGSVIAVSTRTADSLESPPRMRSHFEIVAEVVRSEFERPVRVADG